MRGQFTFFDEANNGRAAQAEDLCSLLGGDLLVSGQDADGLAVAEGIDHSFENLVELVGESTQSWSLTPQRKNAGS